MTAEKEAFIEEYEDAFNSQDIDRFAAMFAPSATRADQSIPDLQVNLDLILPETVNLWNRESTISLDDCIATNAGVSCVVTRTGPVEEGLLGGPFVMRHLFELSDDGMISKILLGGANADGRSDEAFQAWLRAEHPDIADGLVPQSERGLVQVFAFDDSGIYLEWVPVWAELGRPTP